MKSHITTSVLTLTLASLLCGACTSTAAKKLQHFDQGNQFSRTGDYRKAIIEYRRALQLDDKFGQARYRLALAYEQVNDPVQALRECVRAADLLPNDNDAQLHAGGLLVLAGQFEDAATRARSVLERDPQNVDALVLLGNASGSLKDSNKARGMLEAAVNALPGEPRLQETLGALEIRRGNLAAAESAFKRAAEIAPQSIQPRESLAMYYWSVGRKGEAERTLKEALKIDSGHAISRDLAVFYFMEGRNKEAEPYLITLLEENPKETVLRLALGDLYTRQRRFDEAIKVYEPLVAEQEASASATARIAFADYSAGRKGLAHDRLKAAVKQSPKETDLQIMSARLLLADRRFQEAEVTARAALKLTPDRFEALYALGTAMTEQGTGDQALTLFEQAAISRPRAVGPKIQLGRLYLGRGNKKTALRFAREALEIDPHQPLARALLVRVLFAQGDFTAAEQALKPLLQDFPNSPQAQAMAGDMAFVKGDRESARRAYIRALELDPASAEALNGFAVLQVSSGKNTEAFSLVDRLLTAQPNNPKLLLVAARTHLAANDAKRAETLLQQAIKIAPSSSLEAYSALANLYFNQKRLDEAKMHFAAIASQQPDAIGPPVMVGIILQLQGKPKEAQAAYERLLQTHPDAAIAANNLAMLLVEGGGNLDMALNYAQSAKKALADDPNISDTLGLVYYKKGLASLAVTAFEQSTQRQPANPEFWLHLGQAYVAAGNKVKARDALQRALKLNPEFAGAPTAVKALEDLNKRA